MGRKKIENVEDNLIRATLFCGAESNPNRDFSVSDVARRAHLS
jgi:hypothetical protein